MKTGSDAPLTMILGGGGKPRSVADSMLFITATEMQDHMRNGTPVYRRHLMNLGANDLYPGGRLVKLAMESARFNLEIVYRRTRANSYVVNILSIEEKRA